ncbi:MAG: tRNA (adenosine(37)-N6)-dimethylallyltransferase MiaA [Planctomycetes bacterium]|nr:tRNA (adenosine(37)-N6)-dimethylallyltransferase MiaA [Planctomycetota bacterium]
MATPEHAAADRTAGATPDATSGPAPVPILTGPTAAGKTALALAIAERWGLEIASMDSMAVYRRMDVGTAKPAAVERARVPHHLIDLVEPSESFDTATWCRAAEDLLAAARRTGRRLLFVGGTPLYLMAFFKGMLDGSRADPALRAELAAREAAEPGALHRELARRDPEAAARIHPNDHKRLIRALEVLEQTGRPISAQQTTFASDAWRVPCRIVVVDRDRDELRARIRARTERMLDAGLLDETRAIRDSCGFSRTAAAAIGYAECLQHLARPFKDREELRNRIRRATHRLVRRQLTWLRRLREARWVRPDAPADAVAADLLG